MRLPIVPLVLVALAAAWAGYLARPWLTAPQAEPRAITPRGDLAADEQTTIAIFRQASPSVVFITTVKQILDPWSRRIFEARKGTGSGIIWDADGHVVTNFHVIEGATDAQVRLADGRAYPAVLVGASPENDLAVLRINVPFDPPPPVPLGTSADLKVGQKAFAIGNPFGLDHTLTSGIVSALDRTLMEPGGREIRHLIQTDAAINPGNSGGPLLDSAGRLIGINTAIYSPSGAYAGIGFAIPVDTVNRIVPQLIAYGREIQPYLGVFSDDQIAAAILQQLGVQGVLVLKVEPGSPAAKAGLRPTRLTWSGEIIPGDVILRVDDRPVASMSDLRKILAQHRIGDRIRLTVWRQGKLIKLETLLAGPHTEG